MRASRGNHGPRQGVRLRGGRRRRARGSRWSVGQPRMRVLQVRNRRATQSGAARASEARDEAGRTLPTEQRPRLTTKRAESSIASRNSVARPTILKLRNRCCTKKFETTSDRSSMTGTRVSRSATGSDRRIVIGSGCQVQVSNSGELILTT